MKISDLHIILNDGLFIDQPIFCKVVLNVREKEYFCSGKSMFFINDKQKINTYKSLNGHLCF
jgi:hypothetical protein